MPISSDPLSGMGWIHMGLNGYWKNSNESATANKPRRDNHYQPFIFEDFP